jgi:hypothetical protein
MEIDDLSVDALELQGGRLDKRRELHELKRICPQLGRRGLGPGLRPRRQRHARADDQGDDSAAQ